MNTDETSVKPLDLAARAVNGTALCFLSDAKAVEGGAQYAGVRFRDPGCLHDISAEWTFRPDDGHSLAGKGTREKEGHRPGAERDAQLPIESGFRGCHGFQKAPRFHAVWARHDRIEIPAETEPQLVIQNIDGGSVDTTKNDESGVIRRRRHVNYLS